MMSNLFTVPFWRCSLFLMLVAPAAWAQNRDHPGLVHLGDGEWGTPAEALESGLVEYRGRWVSKKIAKKTKGWERQDSKGLDWEDAYKVRTKYYRVKTNVPRFTVETEIVPFLDALGDTYMKVFKEDFGLKGKAVKNKDLTIYGSFEEYSLHEGDGVTGRPRTNPGFIIDGAQLVVFYEASDPALFYGTVFHEGAHQFFLSLLPGATLPIWLDEALATWFEGATYSRATQKITIGAIPSVRLLSAKNTLSSTTGSAKQLFMNVEQRSFTAKHYALAWSFLHYLIKRPGDDNTEKFAKFLRKMNGSGSTPISEVFAETTGEDFDQLSSGWREHVDALPSPEDGVKWVSLRVKSATEDIQDGDLVASIDGVDVFSPTQFSKLWRERAKDRPIELVLVRCTPSYVDPYSENSIVRVEITPESKSSISAGALYSRHDNLRD